MNVLLKNQPYHTDYIKEVNDSNLSEIIAVLKYAVHLTILDGKYKVRDAQVISLLNLYKSFGNRFIGSV